MNPSVSSHVTAIRRRLAESIFPALPVEAEFAREQAEFVLKGLDLVLAVHEHEYRYEVVELHDYVAALRELASARVSTPALESLRARLVAELDHPAPGPDEASLPLAELAERVRAHKALAADFFTALSQLGGSHAEGGRAVIEGLAQRQVERERALFSVTGYTDSERPLEELLLEGPYVGRT